MSQEKIFKSRIILPVLFLALELAAVNKKTPPCSAHAADTADTAEPIKILVCVHTDKEAWNNHCHLVCVHSACFCLN